MFSYVYTSIYKVLTKGEKKMKKIMFFGYTLEVGGAEKVLVDYINELQDKYEITVVLLQKKGEFLESVPKNIK